MKSSSMISLGSKLNISISGQNEKPKTLSQYQRQEEILRLEYQLTEKSLCKSVKDKLQYYQIKCQKQEYELAEKQEEIEEILICKEDLEKTNNNYKEVIQSLEKQKEEQIQLNTNITAFIQQYEQYQQNQQNQQLNEEQKKNLIINDANQKKIINLIEDLKFEKYVLLHGKLNTFIEYQNKIQQQADMLLEFEKTIQFITNNSSLMKEIQELKNQIYKLEKFKNQTEAQLNNLEEQLENNKKLLLDSQQENENKELQIQNLNSQIEQVNSTEIENQKRELTKLQRELQKFQEIIKEKDEQIQNLQNQEAQAKLMVQKLADDDADIDTQSALQTYQQNYYDISGQLDPDIDDIEKSLEILTQKIKPLKAHDTYGLFLLNEFFTGGNNNSENCQKILFSEKQSDQSVLSLQNFVNGLTDQVVFNLEFNKAFAQKFPNFTDKAFVQKLFGKELNLNEKDIIIYKISQKPNGQVDVSFDVQNTTQQQSNQQSIQQDQQTYTAQTIENKLQQGFKKDGIKLKIELDPLVKAVKFSVDMLEPEHNQNYTEYYKLGRGGKDYHVPKGWKRFALKVIGVYKNEKWLQSSSDFKSGTWAVSFHGTSKKIPKKIYKDQYIVGRGQAYQNDIDINTLGKHKGEKIGKGVYSSPRIEEAEAYCSTFTVNTSEGNLTYKMVIMNRVKPSMIREPQGRPDYWVINDPKHLRPYGLLFKQVS